MAWCQEKDRLAVVWLPPCDGLICVLWILFSGYLGAVDSHLLLSWSDTRRCDTTMFCQTQCEWFDSFESCWFHVTAPSACCTATISDHCQNYCASECYLQFPLVPSLPNHDVALALNINPHFSQTQRIAESGIRTASTGSLRPRSLPLI